MLRSTNGVVIYANERSSYQFENLMRFWSAGTIPSASKQLKIQKLLFELTRNGLWAKLGYFACYAMETQRQACVNWIDPFGVKPSMINPGAISFTQNKGFSSDGISGYIDTNLTWASPIFPKTTLDTNHHGVLIENTGLNGIECKYAGVTSNERMQINKTTSDTLATKNQNGTAITGGAMAGNGIFHLCSSRPNGAQYFRFINGVKSSPDGATGGMAGTTNLCGLRSGASGYAVPGAVLMAHHAGNYLTDNEAALISAALISFVS